MSHESCLALGTANAKNKKKYFFSLYSTLFGTKILSMGVRRGGQEGALAPPWPA